MLIKIDINRELMAVDCNLHIHFNYLCFLILITICIVCSSNKCQFLFRLSLFFHLHVYLLKSEFWYQAKKISRAIESKFKFEFNNITNLRNTCNHSLPHVLMFDLWRYIKEFQRKINFSGWLSCAFYTFFDT